MSKAKHVYIQDDTDAALKRIGGADRAKRIRRAVALAEVAGELADIIEGFERATDIWLPKEVSQEHIHEAEALHMIRSKMLAALNKYREIKHED